MPSGHSITIFTVLTVLLFAFMPKKLNIKLIYFILFVILGYQVNKFYTTYHEKRHQRIISENNILLELKELENEQKIMKIQNEQLTQDVDKKSKELAVSTMNLIKKTELLNIIKGDLKNSTDSSTNSIKSVISTINKNVKEENTWNLFKEAFDSADNNFLKKVKESHPSLTPNDLRLCAYLMCLLNLFVSCVCFMCVYRPHARRCTHSHTFKHINTLTHRFWTWNEPCVP